MEDRCRQSGRSGSSAAAVVFLGCLIVLAAVAPALSARPWAQAGAPLPAHSAAPRHMASMLPPAGTALLANPQYDEQLGLTFTQNFTSLGYDVTAVAQTDPSTGTGPAYLLNGLTNKGYWYQVGLSWDWSPGFGFGMAYEVFDSSGNSIYPSNGGGGLATFSGTINHGDAVHLSLSFSGGNVVMSAQDPSTGASAAASYTALGATLFVGDPTGPANGNGFFTGLMTEAYHGAPYYGDYARVVYSQSVALTSGWMWMDEFDASSFALVFSVCANSCSAPTVWSNPTQLQYLVSNGATEASDAYEFVTGSLSPPVILTMSYSVQGGGTGYSPPTLTYVSGGVPQSAQLSRTATNYYMDTGSSWSVSALLGGSTANERWETTQTTSGSAQSPVTIDFLYYHQYSVSFSASVQGGGSGYSTPAVAYVRFGVQQSAQPGVSLWVDAGSSYSLTNPLGGSTATQRWFAGQLAAGAVQAAGPVSVVYYHQYPLTLSYQVIGGGSPSPPLLVATYLGQPLSEPVAGLQPGEQGTSWLDSGAAYQLAPTLPSSSDTERWYGSGASGSMGGPETASATYYHQFYVAVSYQVVGGGAPPAPTLSFWSLGVATTSVLTGSPSSMWVDDNAWSAPSALAGSSASERWSAAAPNGTVTSSSPLALRYFHQFGFQFSYSVSDGSHPAPPDLLSTSFGAPMTAALTQTASTLWLDSGAGWSVNRLLNGSGSSERWVTFATSNGTAASSQSVSLAFRHQFTVDFASAQPAGGTMPASGWYDATSTLRLQASASPGWQFESWTGAGNGSYSGNVNPQNVTVLSPMSENATFYPGLALTVSEGGGVEYSWAGKSGTASGSFTLFVPVGTNVTLRASPGSFLFVFTRFTGAVNTSSGTASVVVGSPLALAADFAPNYPVDGGIAAVAIAAAVGAYFYLRKR